MGNKGALTKSLAGFGTVLVWLPIMAAIITYVLAFIRDRAFPSDFLIVVELFPFALAGGILLAWAALRARLRRTLIISSVVVSAVSLIAGQVLAVITGMASGVNEPSVWAWALVSASLFIYIVAEIVAGAGGFLLLSEMRKNAPSMVRNQ